MNLSPVRPRRSRMLRAIARPATLAWGVLAIAVAAAVSLVPVPGSGLAGTVLGFGLVARMFAVSARAERERHALGALGLRAPRAADPASAPAPSGEALGRRYRRTRGLLLASIVFPAAALVATPWLATADDASVQGLPHQAMWVVGPAAALWWATEIRSELRALAPMTAVRPDDLPRALVTVLGFSIVVADWLRLVVADGAVAVPPDVATGEYDQVWAARITRRTLRDLVPGDVLVRDGELAEGGVIALSDGTENGWVTHVARVDRSELGGPRTWREGLARLEAEHET